MPNDAMPKEDPMTNAQAAIRSSCPTAVSAVPGIVTHGQGGRGKRSTKKVRGTGFPARVWRAHGSAAEHGLDSEPMTRSAPSALVEWKNPFDIPLYNKYLIHS